MATKERKNAIMTRMSEIRKRMDAYSKKSANDLQREVDRRVKKVYVTALECIEMRFGKEFAGYMEMRSKILRCGNDATREIGEIIGEVYNVEKIPTLTIVNTAQVTAKALKEGEE